MKSKVLIIILLLVTSRLMAQDEYDSFIKDPFDIGFGFFLSEPDVVKMFGECDDISGPERLRSPVRVMCLKYNYDGLTIWVGEGEYDRIYIMEISSPDISLANNFSPGMPIDTVKKQYPDLDYYPETSLGAFYQVSTNLHDEFNRYTYYNLRFFCENGIVKKIRWEYEPYWL